MACAHANVEGPLDTNEEQTFECGIGIRRTLVQSRDMTLHDFTSVSWE